MGAKRTTPKTLELPRGVTIRHFHGTDAVQIAFSVDGRQCRELMQRVQADQNGVNYAERQLRQIRSELQAGTFDYAKWFPGSKALTHPGTFSNQSKFRDFADYYVKTFWGSKEGSTIEGYRSLLETRILPTLGDMRLCEIDHKVLVDFLRTQANALILKSLRNLASALRRILREAVTQEIMPVNPLANGGIKLADLSPVAMRKSGKKIDPFSLHEMDQILNVATGQMRNLIEFWRWTGVRTGEIIGLRWEDIDFNRRIAHVKHNVVKKSEKQPKTENGIRDVELCKQALAALNEQQVLTGRGARVFVNMTTGLPLQVSNEIYREWLKVIRRAGVRYRRPYQLRHTYASTLLTAGANIKFLAKTLGHGESTEMLFKHYGTFIKENTTHTIDDFVEAALRKRPEAAMTSGGDSPVSETKQ